VGSSPTPRTRITPTVSSSNVVQFEDFLRNKTTKKGYPLSKSTISSKLTIINTLQRNTNLWDVEKVEKFIDSASWSNGRKQNVAYAYRDWCDWKGFIYEPKKYRRIKKIPSVPLERDIDQLIGGFANSKYGAFLQLLKETGFRPVEASRLQVNCFDFTKRVVTLNHPAKGSNPRQLRISSKLVNMLVPLVAGKKGVDLIWATKVEYISESIRKKRNQLATQLGNPRLREISLKSLRHYKGSTEYAKTKDLIHVKNVLGHVSIQNTMVYIHILGEEPDESFTVKVAETIDEYIKLLELGFEFISDYEGKKILRKRK